MLTFRYDDYSAAEEIRIDIDKAIFGIFRSQKVPLTVGVTPLMASDVHDPNCETYADLSDDRVRVDMLRRGLDLGWDIALHGLTHRRSARDSTEFATLSRRVQSQRIQEGRDRLRGCVPGAELRVFIPPWNNYDRMTVQASASNGFSVLCAGALAAASVSGGVRIIPSVLTMAEFLTYVKIFSPQRFLSDVGDKTVIVTLHEYEFRGANEDGLTDLQSALTGLSAEGARYGLVSQANPLDCKIPDRTPFMSKVEIIRKLHCSWSRDLVMRIAATTRRSARQALTSAFEVAVATAAASDRAKRAVKNRLRPLRARLVHRGQRLADWLHLGPRYECPCCEYAGSFSGFHGRQGRCPSCGSLERHRFIEATVGPLLKKRPVKRRALMLAPDALLPNLCSSFERVVTGDIACPNVNVTFDVEDLPFRAGTFDAIVAVHVLDEVENDRRALEECWRCLSPGGWLIAPLPVEDSQETLELDERAADGKIRLAGRDYFDRVVAQGFAVVKELDPLDDAFSDLHERVNIRTPFCLPGSEAVVVFEKL